jgi:hypothetical protein
MTDPDRARSGSVIRVSFYSDAMITDNRPESNSTQSR